MRRVFDPIVTHAKRIRYSSVYKNAPRYYLIEDVPYYSQWESPELIDDILSENIKATDDPRWKESGAIDKQEYDLWSQSACGMACTKMILAYKLGKIFPIVELGKKCAMYGGYKIHSEKISGLIYRPYVKFLKGEYYISAKSVSYLLISQVIGELRDGNFVIASVNYDIRRPKSYPAYKGGHLVLILGYDLLKKNSIFSQPIR